MNLQPKYYATSKQGPAVGPFETFVEAITHASAALALGAETEATVFGLAEYTLRKPVLEVGDSRAEHAAALRAAALAAVRDATRA